MTPDLAKRESSATTAGRWRRAAGGPLLALLSCGLAFVVAELLIRLAGLAPPAALFTVSAQEFSRVPGIFSPNQSVIEGTGTRFEHPTQIDSLGYRGVDFPRRKEAGEFRVLYVGDSFTYGHNVADDETLPAQLEAQLTTVCDRARVINAGLSGSTIVGEDEMALRGLAVAPDLVVLMYHENDIDELLDQDMWSKLAENRRVKSQFPVSVVYRLLRHGAIWNLAQDARRATRNHPAASAVREADQPVPLDAVAAAHRRYRKHLSALADTLRSLRVPLLFVLFPHPESVRAGRGGRDYDRIRASAEGIGLPMVDLMEPLQRSGVRVEDAFLLPEDYHPSAQGYRIAAVSLSAAIIGVQDPQTCQAVSTGR